MAEDDRPDEKGTASRDSQGGLGIHVGGGRVQSGADEESAGQPGCCRMSQGRSVPARGESEQTGPQRQILTCYEALWE